jgi:Zn-dependent protease/predicted transcriptional regulator
MFTQSVRFGKIFGIPVGVNYSWFIVFVLVTLTFGSQFAGMYPDWSLPTYYIAALISSILFFLSVLLHELGHSLAAQSKGIKVKAITLFIFGGVAQISREPDRPMTEFYIAIMGPVVSVLLAIIFGVFTYVIGGINDPVAVVTGRLAFINTVLVLFNMLPGFPLDGGRVLRAVLWFFTGSYDRATRIASGVGQGFAYLFIIAGIWFIVGGNWMQGVWIAFIGWFLLTAAQQVSHYVTFRSALAGTVARDVMDTECPRIDADISVLSLVEDHMLKSGRRCYLVTEGGELAGLVTLHQIKETPRTAWPDTTIKHVMTPFDQLYYVSPETSISEVLELMNSEDISQVPVVRDGRLEGLIGRNHLLKLVRTKLELGM